MNGSRQKYRLDDYLQDKAQRAASPLARGGSSGLRQGMAVTPTGNASAGTVKPLPVRPPHTVQRPSGSSYNASNAGGGQGVTVDTIKPDAGGGAGGGVLTQSQMTTAYTKQLMENALNNLLAMQNRKFQYDAHSSPLYSIVQKQAEENARLASGRAYAQAKGATGGYGSSYATLAADEAGRQAMRELDDQQLALYEAARAEFEAENASALDWYNTTKQLYEDAYVLEQNAKAKAPATMTLEDGTTVEVTDAARELYAGYLDSFNQGTGYDTLKTAMINGGASEADADQAIAMFKKLGGATVADQISALEASPTLSGAAEAYLAAQQNGTLDRDAAKISAGAKAAVEASLKNAGDNEEAMNTALAEAAQAVKDGYMSESDYVSIITADIHADIKDMESGDEKISDRKKRKRILDSIEGIILDHEEGNLSDSGYQMALLEMVPYLKQYFPEPEHLELQSQYANQYQFSYNLNAKQREVIRKVLYAYERDKVSKGTKKAIKGGT